MDVVSMDLVQSGDGSSLCLHLTQNSFQKSFVAFPYLETAIGESAHTDRQFERRKGDDEEVGLHRTQEILDSVP